MEFCPKCDRKLALKFRSRGALYCPRCDYKKEVPDDYSLEVWSDNKGVNDANIVVLDGAAMELLTHPTISTYCEDCGATKAEAWIVAFGSEGVSSVIYHRCLSCGHTWRETE